MWLLTGPFDSEIGDVSATKTKLLKTGRKFPLGRKDRLLSVNHKRISRDHCEFTVGHCTQDDVLNPSFVPRLEIYNGKGKAMSINREGQAIIANASSLNELKSGDKINIVVGITLEVQWRRVACFLPPARSLPSISGEDCATLGISLMTSPNSLATHHLTPKYELSVPLATSLLSATQLVKVEWLQELIRLGTTPDDGHPLRLAPLEQSFSPPPESKYRPVFSPSLASPLKFFKFWDPNEGRLHLLKGYRFVLLGDGEGQADRETRELVTRGDGEYEFFPLSNGETKWRQLLAKAKRKVDDAGLKVAIIVHERLVRATIGEDKWQEMKTEAQSLSIPFVSVDALMNAVVNTDVSLISEGFLSQGTLAESESSLPDFVPNTHPDEPSLPVGSENAPAEPSNNRRKSPSPSPPAMLFGLPIPPPPSKKLVRRAKPLSSSSTRAEEPVVSNVKDGTQAESLGYTLPPIPVVTRPAKLKRRSPAPTRAVEQSVEVSAGSEEPPLKKFKALFDASDPDKMAVDAYSLRDVPDIVTGDSIIGFTQGGESVTQNDSRPSRSQTAIPLRVLDAVAEEEEESSRASTGPAVPTSLPHLRSKSPLPQVDEEPDTNATQGPGTNGGTSLKRTKSKVAQKHQLDTDPAFLTALASKKGKKTAEDEFDREFNNLRISRPDICREEVEQEWEVLGDFDADSRSLRGNFMVIVDLEVFRRESRRSDAPRLHVCDGRPNFKKFKKTRTLSSRVPVELVARAEEDYGVGLGYWKDNASRDEKSWPATQTQGTQKRRATTVLESDDADSNEPVPVPRTTKRTGRRVPQSQSKGNAAADKLFLGSDEEGCSLAMDLPGTTSKSRTTKTDALDLPTKGNKRRHIVVDDDSDDGMAFKGFGKKRRVR